MALALQHTRIGTAGFLTKAYFFLIISGYGLELSCAAVASSMGQTDACAQTLRKLLFEIPSIWQVIQQNLAVRQNEVSWTFVSPLR